MEESTQEGDDETVIVYGEQSVESPWKFSQASRKSQDSINSTRQNENENSPHRQQEAPSSNRINRKRRHRSPIRSPNFRRRNNLPKGGHAIQDEDLNREGVDHFASLRDLLSREESLSQPQHFAGGTKCPPDIPKERDERGDGTRIENVPIPNNVQESANGELCSPPDFDLCTSDNDDYFENENSWKKNHHKRLSSSGKTKQSANSSNTSSRRNSNRCDESKGFSSVSSAPISSTTKSRKRNRPETISRRVFSSSLNSQKEKQQPDSSQPTQSATNVENVKSIVGLRPTHWHRNKRAVQNRNSSSNEKKFSQQLAKRSSLMAATRFSFHKKTNRASQQSKRESLSPIHHTTNTRKSSSSSISPIRNKGPTDSRSQRKTLSSEATKTSFSFAPSFVPTKASALSQDSIGDDSGDDSRVIAGPINHSLSSTPPRRRRKAANGEWVRRFVSLQNNLNNDAVRIQNKAFARQRMLLDVSDPRKRAKTVTDVTILGQYTGPWINVPEDMKITVLGYAHRHTKRKSRAKDMQRHIARQQQTQEETTIVSQNFFAWFTFTLATARRIELQQGCKLRIYNAIILPSRLPTALDAPPPFLSGEVVMDGTLRVKKTVICTQLCERIASFD